MEGRQLAYVKNQKHINLTSAWNITLEHEDLFQHLSRDHSSEAEIIKHENDEFLAFRKEMRAHRRKKQLERSI